VKQESIPSYHTCLFTVVLPVFIIGSSIVYTSTVPNPYFSYTYNALNWGRTGGVTLLKLFSGLSPDYGIIYNALRNLDIGIFERFKL